MVADNNEDGNGQRNLVPNKEIIEIEKENGKFNIRKYREMYMKLLRRQNEILYQANRGDGGNKGKTEGGGSEGDYQDERDLLRRIVQSKQNDILSGVAAGLVCFAFLRYAPPQLKKILPQQKNSSKITKAEVDARNRGITQRLSKLLVEGVLGTFFGWKAYLYLSHQSMDTNMAMAQIPLCKGRSKLAEDLCAEWVDITENRVPPSFWNEIEKPGAVHDAHTWKAMRKFSDNCVRRKMFEDQIRMQQGWDDTKDLGSKIPIPLPTRVPVDQSEKDLEKISELRVDE